MREESYQEQIDIMKAQRKEEILSVADIIVEGKRRKMREKKLRLRRAGTTSEDPGKGEESNSATDAEVDDEAIINQEIASIKAISRQQAAVQTFVAHPWLKTEAGFSLSSYVVIGHRSKWLPHCQI